MPKVFISWSGDASRAIASALADWLPAMLNSIDPFLSTEDLQKGGRWGTDLANQLESSSFGILCMTPTNLSAPWILFEAGALAKMVSDSHVAPFLVGIKPSDLQGPLAQFNATNNDKEDFYRLLRSINNASGSVSIKEEMLKRTFEALWPSLNERIAKVALESTSTNTSPPIPLEPTAVDHILQEILSLSRQQTSLLKMQRPVMPVVGRPNKTYNPSISDVVWSDLLSSINDVGSSIYKMNESHEQLAAFSALNRALFPIEHILNQSKVGEQVSAELVGLKARVSDAIIALKTSLSNTQSET